MKYRGLRLILFLTIPLVAISLSLALPAHASGKHLLASAKKKPVIRKGGIFQGAMILASTSCSSAANSYLTVYKVAQIGNRVTIRTPSGISLIGKASKSGIAVTGNDIAPNGAAVAVEIAAGPKWLAYAAKFNTTYTFTGSENCQSAYTGALRRVGIK